MVNLGWGQQVIGSYPAMNGGFEGTGLIDNSVSYSTAQVSKWVKNNSTTTISEELVKTRSGNKSMALNNSSTTGRRVWSPLVTVASTTSSVTVQCYRRVDNSTNTQESMLGSGNGTTTDQSSGTYTKPTSQDTWEKIIYTRSNFTFTDLSGVLFTRQTGSGGSVYLDDFVVYNGSLDNIAPSSAGVVSVSGATTSSLNVSWGAASGGVDGGGYVVVRYASNPNADNDPNQNGIYAVGNTITNGTGNLVGTVRYIGTSTSFTDTVSLSEGTQYWYKVYTVDKAFNYSAESTGNGTTLLSNTAPVASSVNISGTLNVGQTLTGSYTYTDADSDVQGTSTYKWYRADDASGTNSAAISGATATTYTLQVADVNKYIRFGVVPVASAGTSPGTEAFSSWQGPITDAAAPNATLLTTNALTESNLTSETLTVNLSNTTFVDNVLAKSNFTLNNAPPGVTVSDVQYSSSTSATLKLAYDDTDFDTNVSNLSITVAGTELNSGANLTTSSLPITALIESLSVSTITDFGSKCLNTETTNTFTVSGSNLKQGSVNLASLSGFTYSLNNTDFNTSINIPTIAGTLAATTVYVKFTPTLAQSYNGNIVVSGVGAPSVNRSVTGTGINTPPTVTAPTSASVTTSSAVLGGNITVIGCTNVTERGIYYSTTSGFADGAGTKVSETSASFATGTFTINVSGLSSGTTYYYKAFATSASGTAYSVQGTFTTLKVEPTNHPTSFAASGVTTAAIVQNWVASVAGSQAPDGYLIKASTSAVVDPVDGVDPANSTNISTGTANREVTPGTAISSATFTGMSSGTMYNYKIYPYTNSGAAIDFKIADAPSFSHATLPTALTTPTATNLQTNSATISWALGTHNAGNKVLVFVKQGSAITTGTPTAAPLTYTANTVFGSGTAFQNDAAAFCVYKGDDSSVSITGLNPNLTYNVVIYRAVEASNSNGTNSYSEVLTSSFTTLSNPVTLPYSQNFENTTNEWVLESTGTNKWAIGSATNNGGTKALYISSDNGTSYNYATVTAQSGTNASVRVDLTGLTAATLSFDWKSNGESSFDYGEVYINTGGSDVLISGAKEFNSTTTFATKTIDISKYVGGIVTLKFRWVNDGSGGNQPPFAVDNVNIVPYGIPNFTTTAITNITYNSADSGGTITTDGGSAITARGIVYATTPNPTLSNAVISNGAGNGSYTANLTGLLSNTTYYVRAFVTNSNGTYYANEVSFTTTNIPAPVATAATNISSSGFTANWNAVAGATGYYLDVSTSSTFSVPPTVTLGSEAFENTLTLFTGSGGTYYSANSASADRPASYPFAFAGSYGFGISNGTATITSNNINTATYVSPQLSFKLASFSIGSSGNGADASDTVTVEVSPDGGATYYNTVRISGNSNAYWTYNTTGIASAAYDADNTPVDFSPGSGGSRTSDGYSTVTVTGLPSTPNLKIRISLLNNATAERWVIDDLKVTGLAGSFVMGYNGLAVSGTSQTVTGLTPKTTYYYRVRAVNGSSSLNSNVIQVTTRSGATTWNGTAWSDGAPLKDIDAILDGDYSGASFESKTITVNTGKTLTVNSFVKTGDVTNNGNIIVSNNANFVQAGTFVSGDGASFKVRKDTKEVKRLAYINWSSPMANSSQTLKQFSYGKNANGTAQSSTGTLDNRFYTYYNNAYVLTAPSGTFTKGQGYLIRTPNDFTTTPQIFHAQFEGTIPNAGTITYDHSSLQGNFILLGNPYPSAISYDDFMIQNTNTTGTVYVWNSQVEMENNQYTGTIYNTFTSAGANPANSLDAYIPVGQGFFVQRTNNNPFVFTDTMRRTTEVGVTSKSSTVSKNRFWLELTSPSGAKPQMLLGFFSATTKGIDKGYDAILLDATTETLYSTVEDKKLIIDAHGGFDEADEFSLSANLTTGGNYTISLLQKEGIFSNGQKIYLKDNLTGAVTDLTTDKYEFTDTAGLKSNRFTLQFKSSGVLGSQDLAKEELNIISVGKEVRIKAGQNVATVEIYDLTGKKLIKVQPNQRETVINLSAEGMIVVKVTLQNGREKSKKLIIK